MTRDEAPQVGGGGGGGGRIWPEISTSIFKIYLTCINYNVFKLCDEIDFHCHTMIPKKRVPDGLPQKHFYTFEAPELHFWRFLKRIRR
jgi:hypothetical protein